MTWKMSLANALKGKTDASSIRQALFHYATESAHLFNKSNQERWLLWRYILLGLDFDPGTALRKLRYEQLRRDAEKQFGESNEDDEDVGDDPLSQKSGRWSKVFQDREVLDQIAKDVDRLFVDHETTLTPIATRILHLWARRNVALSYRQGMHEILRPILIVSRGSADEADVYFCFETLMTQISPLYETGTTSTGVTISHLQNLCNDIQTKLLARAAPDVKRKLDELQIEPQLYALRWLRCLFTREFEDRYCMGIWDVLFCEAFLETQISSILDMIAFMSLAMILRCRETILESTSQHEALACLMRYPPIHSDAEAIQLATQGMQLRVLGDGPDPPKAMISETAQREYRLGGRLRKVLGELENQVTEKHAIDQGRMLELIAQAKQIQDVLLQRLDEEDCNWDSIDTLGRPMLI